MIQGLWDRKVEAIIDIKLGYADADSYKYEPMAALLARWETIKKDKQNKHCNGQRKHFHRFSFIWWNATEGIPGSTYAIE